MTDPTPAEALKAEEPLPCPFCGKDATVIITDVRPCNVPGWTDAFSVWCRDSVKCSGRIPRLYQTRDAAIAAWNTRPPPDAGEVRTYREGVEDSARVVVLREAADYLDGYAGGHYMAQSCAQALRGLALKAETAPPAAAIRKLP